MPRRLSTHKKTSRMTNNAPFDLLIHDRDSGMRVLYVHAAIAPRVPREDMYPHDRLAPGIYKVLVPATLSDDAAAMCAFSAFHNAVPMKHLDDIEVTVREPTGKELFPDLDIPDVDALVDAAGPVTKLPSAAIYNRYNSLKQLRGNK